VDITIDDEVITTTMDHQFYVNDCKWKEAFNLTEVDTLRDKKV